MRESSGDHAHAVRALPETAPTSVAGGTKAMAASQALTQATRLLSNVVLARLLAPHDFGVVAIALVVTVFLDQLKDAGTGNALIQAPRITHALVNAVFWLNGAIGVVLSVVVFTTAHPLAQLLGNPEAAPVLRAFAAVTFMTSLAQVHHALLRRDLRFREVAIISAATAVTLAVGSIGLAFFGLGVWALVVGNLASTAVSVYLSWHYDRWRPTARTHWGELRPIARYSTHLFLTNFLSFFYVQSDKVLVGRFLGAAPLGVYTLAQRILMYPLTAVSDVVNEIAFPVLAKNQQDDEAVRTGFVRATCVTTLITFPLMFGTAAVAEPAVHVIFGERWLDLIPLIQILAPIGALQTIMFTSNGLLLAKGRSDLLFRLSLVNSVVVVGGYVIGLQWGLVGMCVAYAIAILLLMAPSMYFAFRLVGLRQSHFGRAMLPQIGTSLAMFAATFAVVQASGPLGSVLSLLAGVVTGVVVYVGLVAFLRPPAFEDALTVLRSRRHASVPEDPAQAK